jgi:hypothetical protein
MDATTLRASWHDPRLEGRRKQHFRGGLQGWHARLFPAHHECRGPPTAACSRLEHSRLASGPQWSPEAVPLPRDAHASVVLREGTERTERNALGGMIPCVAHKASYCFTFCGCPQPIKTIDFSHWSVIGNHLRMPSSHCKWSFGPGGRPARDLHESSDPGKPCLMRTPVAHVAMASPSLFTTHWSVRLASCNPCARGITESTRSFLQCCPFVSYGIASVAVGLYQREPTSPPDLLTLCILDLIHRGNIIVASRNDSDRSCL